MTDTEFQNFEVKARRALSRFNFVERIVKRIEHAIIALRNMQGAEALSAISSICVCAPLFANPQFFDNAPYFRGLAQHIDEPVCAWVFLSLAVCQLLGLIFGAEPPAFPVDGLARILWLYFRLALLVMSAMIWATMAYLISTPTLTFWGCWCIFLGGGSSWSCVYLMLFRLKPAQIMRERHIEDEGSTERFGSRALNH